MEYIDYIENRTIVFNVHVPVFPPEPLEILVRHFPGNPVVKVRLGRCREHLHAHSHAAGEKLVETANDSGLDAVGADTVVGLGDKDDPHIRKQINELIRTDRIPCPDIQDRVLRRRLFGRIR